MTLDINKEVAKLLEELGVEAPKESYNMEDLRERTAEIYLNPEHPMFMDDTIRDMICIALTNAALDGTVSMEIRDSIKLAQVIMSITLAWQEIH